MLNYSMKDREDQELFPLSWLSQYGYCPRRCGLLALEQLWAENAETSAGSMQHQRVHSSRIERRNGRIDFFELPVFSRKLGVNGKCDCVEATESPQGTLIPYGEGRYLLYPVEYKHGIVRDEEEYHMQLCAQAMCLEEQFDCSIPAGAIFFINAHRRNEVMLTQELREKTCKTADSIRKMLDSQKLPQPIYSAKCKKCSMKEECQPAWKMSARGYADKLWGIAKEEEA